MSEEELKQWIRDNLRLKLETDKDERGKDITIKIGFETTDDFDSIDEVSFYIKNK